MSNVSSKGSESGHWTGLDVSKMTFDAGWLAQQVSAPSSNLAALPAKAFARTREGAKVFLQWLDAQHGDDGVPVRCVMEATGRYSLELAVWLLELRPSLAPAIAPPRQTSAFMNSLGVRNMTDKLAARTLAVYGRERQPRPYEAPSPEEQALREVSRHRDVLVRQRTMVKNQLGETSTTAFVRKSQRKHLRWLNREIQGAEVEMKRVVDSAPELKHDVELLDSVYGVAFKSAVVIRAELGDLRRFDRARQLSAYAGLNPSQRISGTSVHKRTRMGKQGNPRVRQALYLCAMVAIQGENDFSRTYQRLIADGKSRMASLGVVMRKMLVLMRALLIHGIPYEPDWKLCGKPRLLPS